MAERECSGVGGIGRTRHRGEAEPGLHHLLHLDLVGVAPPGDRALDLIGRVLNDLAPARPGFGEGQSARLAHAHRGSDVGLEEHLLDCDDVRSELGDECGELVAHLGKTLRQRIRRRRADDSEAQRDGAVRTARLHGGKPATGEPWVDAEDDKRLGSRAHHEHRFEW